MKYIYQHLGLGDYILCNGLIRNLIKPNEEYSLFVLPHNLKSVEFMYRDLDNLKYITASDDDYIFNFVKENNISKQEYPYRWDGKDDFIRISLFEWCPNCTWDEVFYYCFNVDFKERWDSFKVPRDSDREKKLYEMLNPDNEEFILIHRSGSDGVDRIDYNIIDDKVKKIFVEDHTQNIFDYLLLVERAKEVHCVESSFHLIVDSIDLNDNLFFHTQNNSRGFFHRIRDKWKIV